MANFPPANKHLGQHFLKDKNTIDIITNDFAKDCDVIIEVGPGPGVLTKSLAAHNKPLILIEKDSRFIEGLREYTDEVLNTDALKLDWTEFLSPYQDKKVWLVSNLPYNVGTPLFIEFLKHSPIKYMTLMFQKEVGEKTYLREVKNSTNGLLTLSSIYFESKLLKKVSPGCFSPPPKVDSVVVTYQRKETPEFELSKFREIDSLTRLIFSKKRKQLGTVLKGRAGVEKLKESSPDILKLRAEALKLDQVYDILRNFLS